MKKGAEKKAIWSHRSYVLGAEWGVTILERRAEVLIAQVLGELLWFEFWLRY